MKKILIAFAVIFTTVLSFSVCAYGAMIDIITPSELEIMPGRDFYVVGRIERGNQSAESYPLNIKIELISSSGEVLREIKSNVLPNGLTSATQFMLDYEYGTTLNDSKGLLSHSFTPPDVIYDGFDRDSIRNASNKIVVKDGYYAGIVYAGGTKDINLKYEDENGSNLKDLSEGVYTLRVSAINFDGETVCTIESEVLLANEKERFIADDSLADFAKENDLVMPFSITGYWKPDRYLTERTNAFTYFDNARFILNSDCEFSKAKKTGILLNYVNKNDASLITRLGSAFSEESETEVEYYYYDIGEKNVKFSIAGQEAQREGVILKSGEQQFIKLLRGEHHDIETNSIYPDFDLSDGFVLSENTNPTFYGVFTPVNAKSSSYNGTYSIKNSVNKIKAVLTGDNSEVICEETFAPGLVRDDETVSLYEFSFSLPVDFKKLEAGKYTLQVFACDGNGKTLIESEKISVKLTKKGTFIGDVPENYWGKAFCESLNLFGQTPSGDAILPDDYISRGNFVALVNNLFGISGGEKVKFSDMTNKNVFYDDFVTAVGQGYITGDEHGRIKPDDLISREEAIIVLSRIANADMGDVSFSFLDSDQISFWAEKYVNVLASNGIVSGFDGYLHPKENITSAEAVALVIKTIKWLNNSFEEEREEINNTAEDLTDFSEFADLANIETLNAFYVANKASFDSIAKYITKEFTNGIYISKVGNGLEMRDYTMGNFVTLSTRALNIVESLSTYFDTFSIRHNPKMEDCVHFVFGKDDNGKEIGLTYTIEAKASGKTLQKLDENWYYFSKN